MYTPRCIRSTSDSVKDRETRELERHRLSTWDVLTNVAIDSAACQHVSKSKLVISEMEDLSLVDIAAQG